MGCRQSPGRLGWVSVSGTPKRVGERAWDPWGAASPLAPWSPQNMSPYLVGLVAGQTLGLPAREALWGISFSFPTALEV